MVDALNNEEREVLIGTLGRGLKRRGTRDVRWWGVDWQGRGRTGPAEAIPKAVEGILQPLAKRMGFPHFDVATVHRYRRDWACWGSGRLAGKRLAIIPHTDDPQLEGVGQGSASPHRLRPI